MTLSMCKVILLSASFVIFTSRLSHAVLDACEKKALNIVNFTSTLHPSLSSSNDAKLANDGVIDIFNSDKCAISQRDCNVSWTVKFDKPSDILGLKLHLPHKESLKWTNRDDRLNISILIRRGEMAPWEVCNSEVSATLDNPVEGQCLANDVTEVRIQRNSPGILSLCEVEVFTPHCNLWNDYSEWSACKVQKMRTCVMDPCASSPVSSDACNGAKKRIEFCVPERLFDPPVESPCENCSLPFKFDRKVYKECIDRENGVNYNHKWCSVTPNFNEDLKWKFCREGPMWQPWTSSTCKTSRTRTCRGDPSFCLGPKIEEKECNQSCVPILKADVTFVLDSSSSISKEVFTMYLKPAVRGIISFLLGNTTKNGSEHLRFAAITYRDTVKREFSFDNFTDRSEYLTAVKDFRYFGRGTATGLALKYVRETMHPLVRPNVHHAVIVITDGLSNRGPPVKTEAMLLRNAANAPRVYLIGVTANILPRDMKQARDTFHQIPSHQDFYAEVDSYQQLMEKVLLFAQKICASLQSK